MNINQGAGMPEQMLVLVRITAPEKIREGTLRLTAIQDGEDKGESPRTLIDKTQKIPRAVEYYQTAYANFGLVRSSCQSITFKAVMQVESPKWVTIEATKRIKLFCRGR